MSAPRWAPETEKAIYISWTPPPFPVRPLSDILGCRIDVDLPGATVWGVTDLSDGEIARLRRRWSCLCRRQSIDGWWRHGHLARRAKTSTTATNFSHWAVRVAGCDRPTSVLGRLMNRCVTSTRRNDKISVQPRSVWRHLPYCTLL